MNVLRNNRGVTLIFVALGMFLFLLFLGVAVDTGWIVYVRAQSQARIDSAALAAAGALLEESPTQVRAEELANTFSDKNSVVNGSVDPVNVVTPMKYDQNSGILTETSWALFNGSDVNCNAVRVTTAVPTPVFFAGIRNVFGAGETGLDNINVSAVSHLPCPGLKLTSEGFGPFALRQCAWTGKTEMCPAQDVVPPGSSQVWPFIVRWNATTPIEVGQTITFGQEIQTVEEVISITAPYLCRNDSKITVPVVEATDGQCSPGAPNSFGGLVVGFATICFSQTPTQVGEVFVFPVTLEVKCGEIALSSTGTGQCFGTLASNPILIQ